MPDSKQVLATFFGDAKFPVKWANEDDKQHMWYYDDLHCPNPISPMYASLGWWGPSCEYMYRRFGAPFGKSWPGMIVNEYLYTTVTPREPEEAAKIGPYYGMVMGVYARDFLKWWKERYLPEIERNFEYLDTYPADTATLGELMVHLEEALDIHERHLRLHWILNLAQFQASIDFGVVTGEVYGQVSSELLGRIQISIEDRNWDSIKALWELKEKVKGDATLKKVFDSHETGKAVLPALEATEWGKAFLKEVVAYLKEYGVRAMYCHEFINKQWIEDITPALETIKAYLVTDYDYPSVHQASRDDQAKAIAELKALMPATATADQKQRFENALELMLRMMPLTPNHHFYLDQGTNGRMRLMFLGIARCMKKLGILDDPEDIFYLSYDQLRYYAANPKSEANPGGFDGRSIIKQARRVREQAWKNRPVDWVGTVSHWALYEEPYKTLWGYPERFLRAADKAAEPADVIKGLAAAAGIAEGIARLVLGPEEFDQVKRGEIMVCRMTNPAWVVVFTKLAAVVCDAGGVLAHPAIVSREFGIPAVVGTTNATLRIKTGDRIRVNGSTGVVDILVRA
jgi:phosphohistidine swiveling domain-containing protein